MNKLKHELSITIQGMCNDSDSFNPVKIIYPFKHINSIALLVAYRNIESDTNLTARLPKAVNHKFSHKAGKSIVPGAFKLKYAHHSNNNVCLFDNRDILLYTSNVSVIVLSEFYDDVLDSFYISKTIALNHSALDERINAVVNQVLNVKRTRDAVISKSLDIVDTLSKLNLKMLDTKQK